MSSLSYDTYVLHAYPGPTGGVHWHVLGKYVEAIIKPPMNLSESSRYVTAAEIGLKDSVFVQMRHLLKAWVYYSGREDPKAEFHSFAYEKTKTDLETVTKTIDAAVKRHVML